MKRGRHPLTREFLPDLVRQLDRVEAVTKGEKGYLTGGHLSHGTDNGRCDGR
jgi:hypothetical protein